MKLTHTVINKECLLDLLSEVYDIHSHASAVNLTTNLSRVLKCIELDVKLLLKMSIQYEHKENDEHIFIATVKLILSTQSTCLRKTNHFWNDNEMITIRLEMTTEHFEYLADKIIEQLDHFRICKVCRILFKDSRSNHATAICKYCCFDRIFQFEDASCAICQEVMEPGVQTFALTCAHVFHSDCILTQFIKNGNRFCPLCRETDDHQL
jgi:hypothetical protein